MLISQPEHFQPIYLFDSLILKRKNTLSFWHILWKTHHLIFFSILMFSLISKSRIDLELMEALKSSDFIGGAEAHHLLSHLQLDSGTYLPYLNKKRFKSVKVQRGLKAISYFIYFRSADPLIITHKWRIHYEIKTLTYFKDIKRFKI